MSLDVTLNPAPIIEVTRQESSVEALLQEMDVTVTLPGPQGGTTYLGVLGGNAPSYIFSLDATNVGGVAP